MVKESSGREPFFECCFAVNPRFGEFYSVGEFRRFGHLRAFGEYRRGQIMAGDRDRLHLFEGSFQLGDTGAEGNDLGTVGLGCINFAQTVHHAATGPQDAAWFAARECL